MTFLVSLFHVRFSFIYFILVLLVDGGQVENSTTNEGTNTGCHFEDENISKVGGAEIQSPNDESTPMQKMRVLKLLRGLQG